MNKRKEAHEAYKNKVTRGVRRIGSGLHQFDRRRQQEVRQARGVGYGAGGKRIGPEYSFGLSIAEKIEGPILLIKTSWGGKSLNYNFRPPSAGVVPAKREGEKAKDNADEFKANAGQFYRMMNEQVRDVLDNLKDNHPAYDPAAGYEIAGFVWFQGFNDQFSDEYRRANYKDQHGHLHQGYPQ